MNDPINNLTPGVPMDEEQRKALADANLKESAEAQRLAAEHRARDIAEGKGEPAVTAVAGILKKKLEKEEFQPNERTSNRPPASN